MKVAVTAQGNDLSALVSPVFARCLAFVFVDTETMQFEAVDNPAVSAPRGAGSQAAQLVVNRGAEVVLTKKIGPNALNALRAASIQIFLAKPGMVRDAVEDYKAGRLHPIQAPTA